MKNISNKVIKLILISIPCKEIKRNGFMPILHMQNKHSGKFNDFHKLQASESSQNKKSDFSSSKPTILYKFGLNEYITW